MFMFSSKQNRRTILDKAHKSDSFYMWAYELYLKTPAYVQYKSHKTKSS